MVGQSISHYKIVSELGRGGMGIVYQAEDTRLHRTVAIKVLPSSALSNEDDKARFYREARAAASLTHPHIAVVYEVDEAVPEGSEKDDLRPFIAMEFIEGETLDAKIKKGPLKLEDAVRIAGEIASGLEAAHEKNIVHRDIKSANVMLTAKGEAKILDFGLAQTAQSTKLTKMGSTVGTIGFMSPEQARGEEVDRRTDIWSLGVVLYEMISGKHPFPGEYEQAVVYEILNQDPEPLTAVRTGVPMALEWIVSKMLAKSANNRYQSTAEILVDLKTVDLTDSGFSRTSSVSAPRIITKPKWAMTSLPAAAAAVLVGAALTALAMIYFRPTSPDPAVMHLDLVVPQTNLTLPRLSPSGHFLAYKGTSPGEVRQLHVYEFETENIIVIPTLDAIQNMRFSQDEATIAFLSQGRLFTVPTTGGDPVFWVDNAEPTISWGPNGDIFFRRGNTIMRTEAAGVDPAVFMEPDSSGTSPINAPLEMLPDGKHLLAGTDDFGLYAVDIRDGSSTMIMDRDVIFTQFAPSGHLVYRRPNSNQLHAWAFDPRSFEILGSAPSVVSSGSRLFGWTLSQNGIFVSVRSIDSGTYRLQTVDSTLVSHSLSLPAGIFEAVRASPDERYITLDRIETDSRTFQVVIYDTVSTSLRQLTVTDYNYSPDWSPNGERIVYVSTVVDDQTKNGLYIRNANGSGERELVFETELYLNHPDWSPDGNHIIFRTGSIGLGNLWMYSFETGTAEPFSELVNQAGSQVYPSFSPNGRYIAYLSNETGTYEIWVSNVEGSSKWPVTSDGGANPAWSKDGTHLYFVRGRSIFGVPVDSESDFPIFGKLFEKPLSEDVIMFDTLEEPGSFVFLEPAQSQQMYFEVILNFSEVLERQAPHPE